MILMHAMIQANSWVQNNKDMLEQKLVQHGAILFRGFHLPTAQSFDEFVLSFGYESLPYLIQSLLYVAID